MALPVASRLGVESNPTLLLASILVSVFSSSPPHHRIYITGNLFLLPHRPERRSSHHILPVAHLPPLPSSDRSPSPLYLLGVDRILLIRIRGQDGRCNQVNHLGSFPPGKKITVVFVLGGPGSGKSTQCAKIVNQFGFTHLSAGDLLREEAKSHTEQGMIIKNLMHEGKLVPSEIIVNLLLKAMLESGNDKFLIDGFPRNEENRGAYERIINVEPEFVLFIDCPREEMERRILNRNQGRDDDNIDTIRKRFEVFQESTLPVIQYYEKRGKLKRVDGAKSADAVFEDVKAIFAALNTQANKTSSVSRAQTNPLKRFIDLFCVALGLRRHGTDHRMNEWQWYHSGLKAGGLEQQK
ncbi:hypothetical protein ACP70R_042000 [Stipagrostis hirtigluma subsp. patula]